MALSQVLDRLRRAPLFHVRQRAQVVQGRVLRAPPDLLRPRVQRNGRLQVDGRFEVAESPRVLALPVEHESPACVRIDVLGVEPDRKHEVLHCLVQIALLDVRQTAAVVRDGVPVVEPDRLVEVRYGVVELPERRVGLAPARVRLRALLVELQRPLQVLHRLLRPAQLTQHLASHVVGLGVPRVQPDRLVVVLHRPLVLRELRVRVAPERIQRRIARIEPDRLVVVLDRQLRLVVRRLVVAERRVPAQVAVSVAALHVRLHKPRVELDRVREVRHRALNPQQPEVHRPAVEVGLRVPGIVRQHPRVVLQRLLARGPRTALLRAGVALGNCPSRR